MDSVAEVAVCHTVPNVATLRMRFLSERALISTAFPMQRPAVNMCHK